MKCIKSFMAKFEDNKLLYSILLFLAIVIRLTLFMYKSNDYKLFLYGWVTYFRENGGFLALKESIGNYNIPYLYFLALFSYLPKYDLFLIKFLSCIFDFVLAFAIGKLAERFNASFAKFFFATLFLPTVIINSSLWAQCDSIYVAFGILFVLFALEDKPCLSMACAALSFGFKLQAVFFLPLAFILFLYKKFKIHHFLVFPLTYAIEILPAILLGRPLRDAFLLYLDQLYSGGVSININSASLAAITGDLLSSNFHISLAFIFMFVLFIIAFIFRNDLNDKIILILSVLMVTCIPYFLPHMHERYFYGADVLSLSIIAISSFAIIPSIFIELSSLLNYWLYFTLYTAHIGSLYISNKYGSVLVLCSIIFYFVLLFICLAHSPRHSKQCLNV